MHCIYNIQDALSHVKNTGFFSKTPYFDRIITQKDNKLSGNMPETVCSLFDELHSLFHDELEYAR